ncbi:short chain dehydrogenase family protein [Mycobacterium xenopi 4042]|uniref:Short chain dehydrogenase family protein n=1 Tax=Mycobacterium xenopi 4042 TaxID=1299334 RepID=X8CJC2_MYCXE|nr:short chain dehydrogenase family protein [Mycobacterium xenopi 3993]EUA56477.1 short chain dehydrogenase family protein [Mycobacterium xenopi 4042]
MQVAIVTGASGAIGFGCAAKLAAAGMAVLGTGRNQGRLSELERAVGDPERVGTLAVDLTGAEAPRRIVDAAVARWVTSTS